jgi:AraC-like DNA-binding protein
MTGSPNLLTETPPRARYAGMDALSDVLRVVGLTGGVFLEAEFTAPWAVMAKVSPELCRPFMAPPQEVVSFHLVVEGAFQLQLEDGRLWELRAGEAIMLPHNDAHVMTSAPDLPPVAVSEIVQPPQDLGVARIRHGGGGERTRLVCGFLGGDSQLNPLLAHLPDALKVDVVGMPGGEWIAQSFAYAAQSLSNGDPGAATVAARLAELLFVEAVRRHLASAQPERAGWLAGLRDPAIGRALSLMHANVAESWTADALAGKVNMSRSAFADRFTQLVGQPPMRYLTGWRMQVAASKLRQTHKTIAQIAFEVGYESEAAFTRAFRREMGQPPAAWRREARAV